MASRGTCTLLSEMSVARPGLLWSGGWLGERKWNRGLPGAEPRSQALAWDNAGEPDIGCWSREGEEGQLCLGTRAGAAAGILKLLPPAVIWQDKLEESTRWITNGSRESEQVQVEIPCRGQSTCCDLKSPSDPADSVKQQQQQQQRGVGQLWALNQLYRQRYLHLKLEPAAIYRHKKIMLCYIFMNAVSILLTNQMTCREVHWLDSSFSLGWFGWLLRVPGGSLSPESSCEHSSSSKHRSLIVIKHQRPCWECWWMSGSPT